MNSALKKLFQSIQQKEFAPFYLIDGEEPFYIDLVTSYFEEQILTPAEKDFNLLILYGRDVDWAEVVNACHRYPMFAERQVVILRDAAQMKTLGELAGYLENPSPTTVFLIEHRFKKVDGRGRFGKLAKEKGFYFTSDKIKEEQLPQWIQNYGLETGFHIAEREAQILASYLGNELQKVVNEIEKIRINVPGEKVLSAELIQKYIGVSRDYNLFDFPVAFSSGNRDKLYRMLAYFIANPKSAPLPLVIGTFYSHFNAIYQVHSAKSRNEKEISTATKLYGARLTDALTGAKKISMVGIERCMMLLATYSAKSVGVASNLDNDELLKEMIGRMELVIGS